MENLSADQFDGISMGAAGSSSVEVDSAWLRWCGAICGALMVGVAGVIPVLVIPEKIAGSGASDAKDNEEKCDNESQENRIWLNALLSFAVGGLLGDVFLHLLPEAFQQVVESREEGGFCRVGWSVVIGVLIFLLLEKILEISNPEIDEEKKKQDNKKIFGYLNLMANCTDNLLHGLAVGTSFLTSMRLGVTTTFAILVHEIPHEFGDFAILLNSGFDRWGAAKAQISTALLGMMGALVALAMESSSNLNSMLHNVIPFTAGGFLNIALVSVVPTLMEESRPGPALLQFVSVILGIFAMHLLTKL